MKKRVIVQINYFKKTVKALIAKNKLLFNDFEEFKKNLAEYPDIGDLIPATGGVRKIRLKSASKGKRGGFRVCYLDDPLHNEIFLLSIYPKSEQENLTSQEKKDLKEVAILLKER
jgi:hypothetical protein